MPNYAADRKLEFTDIQVKIIIGFEHPLSLTDFGQMLKDLDAIFRVSARETSSRLKGSNVHRRDAALVAHEFKAGSLEILTNPYFQGTVGSVAASAIVSVFIYVCRRISGRPESTQDDPIRDIENAVIAEERLKEAASEAVKSTAQARKRVSQQVKTFDLKISVSLQNKTHELW